ncbi:MAG: GAF domain-containing sensor histidine kinase [Chloroflexota bacterium]
MTSPTYPHEEPGLSPLEFARLREELQKTNAELAAANAALRETEQELERRVQERTRELSTLLRVSHNITTTLELEPLLGLILDQLREVVEYQLASISIVDEDDLLILAVRGEGMPQPGSRIPLREHVNTRAMLSKKEPAFVPDLNAETPLAQHMRKNLAAQNLHGLNSWMNAPLVFRGQSIGVLALAHPEANYYNASRVELAMAFANQAAVAIENARLYEQAHHVAALEERQKLARELHDSVSQALYGIVLGARTARTLLDRDPTQAAQPLDYILSLSEAGLAEMRALIFELRPESLQTEGLVAALGKLVNALGARHQLKVTLEAQDEPDVSLDVKESLYRITQEALNNIVKHARAQQLKVSLNVESSELMLRISDDGTGFDTGAEFPGHLGMITMRERAEKAGGTFAIESAPNAGTRIQVKIPLSAR